MQWDEMTWTITIIFTKHNRNRSIGDSDIGVISYRLQNKIVFYVKEDKRTAWDFSQRSEAIKGIKCKF